ncbi:Hypothetical_protein [Hexamita inflata]|uniref:Hypothetical_protein n=1 Tax=Hexamita inflata TaxID=28002 RepID=A0AA86NL80_9EUKA|nr:Hypothetical protein HINF_LOCUS8902 [Hexamita inflata]
MVNTTAITEQAFTVRDKNQETCIFSRKSNKTIQIKSLMENDKPFAQPLDISVNKSFKSYYRRLFNDWQNKQFDQCNSGYPSREETVNIVQDSFKLVTEAVIQSGFRKMYSALDTILLQKADREQPVNKAFCFNFHPEQPISSKTFLCWYYFLRSCWIICVIFQMNGGFFVIIQSTDALN